MLSSPSDMIRAQYSTTYGVNGFLTLTPITPSNVDELAHSVRLSPAIEVSGIPYAKQRPTFSIYTADLTQSDWTLLNSIFSSNFEREVSDNRPEVHGSVAMLEALEILIETDARSQMSNDLLLHDLESAAIGSLREHPFVSWMLVANPPCQLRLSDIPNSVIEFAPDHVLNLISVLAPEVSDTTAESRETVVVGFRGTKKSRLFGIATEAARYLEAQVLVAGAVVDSRRIPRTYLDSDHVLVGGNKPRYTVSVELNRFVYDLRSTEVDGADAPAAMKLLSEDDLRSAVPRREENPTLLPLFLEVLSGNDSEAAHRIPIAISDIAAQRNDDGSWQGIANILLPNLAPDSRFVVRTIETPADPATNWKQRLIIAIDALAFARLLKGDERCSDEQRARAWRFAKGRWDRLEAALEDSADVNEIIVLAVAATNKAIAPESNGRRPMKPIKEAFSSLSDEDRKVADAITSMFANHELSAGQTMQTYIRIHHEMLTEMFRNRGMTNPDVTSAITSFLAWTLNLQPQANL